MFDKGQLYQKNKESLEEELKNLQNTLTFQSKKSSLRALKIDAEKFNHIIDIDFKNFTLEVEGMTSYEKIVEETLKLDCLLPIIPSYPNSTVHDSILNCLTSSASFRFGFIQESILELDVLTGTGIYRCSSKNVHSDLFLALPNTGKTLGIILKATLPLIPVKKYVRLSQFYFSDFNTFIKNLLDFAMENREVGSLSFLEGVVLKENEMIISIGEMVEQGKGGSHRLDSYLVNLRRFHEFYLCLADYLWRWDLQKKENNDSRFGVWNRVIKIFNKKSRWLDFEGVISAIEVERLGELIKSNAGVLPLRIYPISPYSSLEFSFVPAHSSQIYFNFHPIDLIANTKKNRASLADIKRNSCWFPLTSKTFYEGNAIFSKNTEHQKLKYLYDPYNILDDVRIDKSTYP